MEVKLQILHDLDLNMSIVPKRYKNLHKVESEQLFQVLEEMKENDLICSPQSDQPFSESEVKDILITKEGRQYLLSHI